MIHLSKLAVGIRDLVHLSRIQAQRLQQDGVLQHRTRLAPKRAEDVLAGGSIYWVIAGTLIVRQRITCIGSTYRDDGTRCVGFGLDPLLVAVVPRATRPFQGWRYLLPQDAPLDVQPSDSAPDDGLLPEHMRQALRSLALL